MNHSVSRTRKIVLCALFAALTAVFSQIALPLPFTPVPVNLATLSVLLAAVLLGTKAGAVSQCVYLLAGAVGLPVFSRFMGGVSVLVGPTGGYLIGYPIAALTTGFLDARLRGRRFGSVLAMIAGIAVCYAFGTLWYVISTHTPIVSALLACVVPFLPGDALKIVAAAILAKILVPRLALQKQEKSSRS